MLALLAFLGLGHALNYQVCVASIQEGQINCSRPLDRAAADMRALVVNVTSQGQGIAWVERVNQHPKGKRHPVVIVEPPQEK